MVTTPEIAEVMAQKIQFNTFGGNPVCTTGGHAVLRVLDKEKRQEHCHHVGLHLIGRLRELEHRHESNFFSSQLCSCLNCHNHDVMQEDIIFIVNVT